MTLAVQNIPVAEADDGQRLDRWFKKYYPEVSFGQVQKILRTGQCRVDGKRAKGETRLAKGQIIRVPPQLSAPQEKKDRGIGPKDIDYIQAMVIYKDDRSPFAK